MRAKKARTEIRQEQIAQAAMKLLARRGWQRISLAAIAREVGVVTSAVYRHFKGKDEVLDTVLDLVEQCFQSNVQAEASDAPIARLHDVLMRHVDLIVSGVPVPRIILSEAVFAGRPRHRKRVQTIYQNYLAEIAAIIRTAQKTGLIQRELNPETLSMMWLGLVQSPAILWLLGQGDFDLKQHCERAWNLFAVAIESKPANTPERK
ncbi:MAG: TetR/AcrR family transcriptional regulator [Verrucomicrobiota bacterium]